MKKQLKIGILGYGTVGSGVPEILKEHQAKIQQVTGTEIEVKSVFVREGHPALTNTDLPYTFTSDIQAVMTDPEISIIVELLGKIEPARSYILEALENGKHVVTANKDLIALHGAELVAKAKEVHCDLFYEASVAGGIPILRTIANSLAADNITDVLGIVNGTTNYMLTKMVQEKKTYEDALAEAQALGFAESDPTNDVDGIDAAYKMIILTQFAFGMNVTMRDIDTHGIRGLNVADIEMAERLGYTIKLIGSSKVSQGSVAVEVGPVLVPTDHPLAAVHNELNAVFVNSQGVGESMYYGPGAGSRPTATSVVSDLIVIAKNIRLGTTGIQFNAYSSQTELTPAKDVHSKYYLSIEVPDKVGQFLKLTQIITHEGGSFDQLIQQKSNGTTARIVAITHAMSKAQAKEMIAQINQIPDFEVLADFKVLQTGGAV